MSLEVLSQRWDGFLGKLRDRYFEILKQAEEPLEQMINNLQYDNVVIINIRNGLHSQTVIQLMQRAEEGWGKMEVEMAKHGKLFWSQKAGEHQKLDNFRKWLSNEFTKFEVGLYAKAGRKILENVKQHIDEKKMHRCTQCAADLPINVFSFMALNLKCASCGSVNTYQPDDRVRALEYYALNQFAEEQAFPAKLAGNMKEYYRSYYTYLMETVPDKKDFYKRDMDERMNNPFFQVKY